MRLKGIVSGVFSLGLVAAGAMLVSEARRTRRY